MIIWLLISILCFWLFLRFIRNVEIKEWGKDWQPLKLPLWAWIVVIVIALLPLFNIIGLFAFELFIIDDVRWGDSRFKDRNKVLILKITDILSKKY